MNYLYDGTFYGFLTVVHAHYYIEKAEGIFLASEYQQDLMRKSMDIETDETQAEKVMMAIERNFSGYDIRNIYRVFQSAVPGKDMALLNYLRLGFSKKVDISRLHGHPIVHEFQAANSKVLREIDKYLGVTRFEFLKGNVAYAKIEPEHDVLELIADHFSDRFRNDPFIIHDLRRGKAVMAYGGQWYMSAFDGSMLPELSDDEKEYQKLWKMYYRTIAIEERRNEKCQKNMLPVKYWKHLTEMRF